MSVSERSVECKVSGVKPMTVPDPKRTPTGYLSGSFSQIGEVPSLKLPHRVHL